MNEIIRKYTFEDSLLLETASRIASSLPEDIRDFQNFDSTMGQHSIDNILASLDDVFTIKTDQVVIDEMAELTGKVNQKMAECNTAYRTVAHFVRKVFKDQKAVQNQFGLNDIDEARNNHPKMIVFMKSLADVAAKYKDKLIEGGINPSVIDSLSILQNELYEANNEQELFKKERGKITQERITRLNQLYNQLRPINDIARIIYADNPAQLAKYTLPTPKSSTNSQDDLLTT
jgi:hypothetical protein